MHKACPQFLTNVYFKGSDLYYIFSALILHDFPWPKICKFVTYRHWIGGSRELSVWQSWTVSATVCNCQRQKSGCFLKVVASTAFRFAIRIDSLISFGQIDSNRFVLLKKSAIRFGRCICLINDQSVRNTTAKYPILRRCILHRL